MKKLLICIVVVLLSFPLCSCGKTTVEKQNAESKELKSMFVCVEDAFPWQIVYHKETKVMYAVSNGDYNRGIFTLLVDADGKPLLWDGSK